MHMFMKGPLGKQGLHVLVTISCLLASRILTHAQLCAGDRSADCGVEA